MTRAGLAECARECLRVLRAGLDRATLHADAEQAGYAWYAIPVFCRGVFLCESASVLARSEQRPAAAALLRTAVECWIDTCYVLYCREPAVAQLAGSDLARLETLARRTLGEVPDQLAAERAELDEIVRAAIAAGHLPHDFQSRDLPVDQRLRRAIEARSAPNYYMVLYEGLYRCLSSSEVHTTGAVEVHAEITEHVARFRVSPSERFDVDVLTALVTQFLCEAAVDVFAVLGRDTAELVSAHRNLVAQLGPAGVEMFLSSG